MTVLLLRPRPKLEKSIKCFSEAGVPCVGLATINIQYHSQKCCELSKDLAEVCENTTLVVTSTFAANAIAEYAQEPLNQRVIAVGHSTQGALKEAGIDSTVPAYQNSEGIVELLSANSIPKEVLIVKGVGGRNLLEQWCLNNSVIYKIYDVYERLRLSPMFSSKGWSEGEIKGIIATSGEQLEFTYNELNREWLIQLPIVVVSERLKHHAESLGFRQIYVSSGASDAALIETMFKMQESLNDG